ncbi:MAG: hypothetical protein DHS20C15_05590 [Planctomycetota bacterium]|nr:MAG: hypothetical protein DHS20C15_05590 [Planctomycetota bacterium]
MRLASAALLLAALSSASAIACAGPKGKRVTPGEFAGMEAQQRANARAEPEAPRGPAPLSSDAAKLASQRGDLRGELEALQARSAQLELEHTLQVRSEALALETSERRLTRARRERKLHEELIVPLRLREAELQVTDAAAAQRLASDELAALELLWADAGEHESDTAAQLIQQARDELSRAAQAHELAVLRRRELLERVLPAELEARIEELAVAELGLEQARLAQQLGATRRARESQALTLERRALDRALANVETENARLGREGGLLAGPRGG